MSADYWRRATAVPSTSSYGSPYGTQMNVVVPQGLNASAMMATYPQSGGTGYYESSPPGYRPSPPDNTRGNARQEAIMYEYDEARKSYLGILQREREELDQTKHEVDSLSYERQQLRRDLAEADARAAAAARDRDIANAKLIGDTAGLRSDVSRLQSELTSARKDLENVHQAYTSVLLEKSMSEATIANLKAEVVSSGRTIVDQTSTIRALSMEMSRRDPYHLIKDKREQRGDVNSATLEEQTKILEARLADKEDILKKTEGKVVGLEKRLKDAEMALMTFQSDSKAQLDRTSTAVSAAYKSQIAELEDKNRKILDEATRTAKLYDSLVEETKIVKAKADSDRLLCEDLSKQIQAMRLQAAGGGAAAPPQTPAQTKSAPPLSDTERNAYDLKLATFITKEKDNQGKLNEFNALLNGYKGLLNRLERKASLGDVATAPLVDCTVSIVSGENILERDPKGKGLHDPYVLLFDTVGNEVIHTQPSPDSATNPKFNPAKDTATIQLAASSMASIRVEVWANGNGTEKWFLGSGSVSTKTLLNGGNSKRPVSLAARENEDDKFLIDFKGSLGFITVDVKLAVAAANVLAIISQPAPAPSSVASPADATSRSLGNTPAATPGPAQKPAVVPSTTTPTTTTTQSSSKPIAAAVSDAPVPRSQPKILKATDVNFYVVGCDGVLARDPFSGQSDPKVKIFHMGDTEALFATAAMSDTANPRWPRDATALTTISVDPADTKPFIFEVWDDDFPRADDFLGMASLTAQEILKGSGQRKLQLQPRPSEADDVIKENKDKLGFLTIEFTLLGETTVPTAGKGTGKAAAAAATAAATAAIESTVRPTEEQVAKVATGPSQKLNIHVTGCKGLFDRGGFLHTTDPYVVVTDTTGDTVLTTPICKSTLDPAWTPADASFTVVVAPTASSFFTFDVLDDEKLVGGVGLSSKYLGFCKLSGSELLALGEGAMKLPLGPRPNEKDEDIAKNAKNLGFLLLRVSRVYAAPAGGSQLQNSIAASGDTSATATTGTGGRPAAPGAAGAAAAAAPPVNVEDIREVVFSVTQVSGVLARNKFFSGSDIFCVITDPNGKRKPPLKTRPKTSVATWDDSDGTVKFNCAPTQAGAVTVEVLCTGLTESSPLELGFLSIKSDELFGLNGETKTFTLTAKPGTTDKTVLEAKDLGKITVKVSISGMKSGRSTTMLAEPMKSRVAVPSTTAPFKVRVWAQACDGLMNRQPNGQISDPYVVITDARGIQQFTPAKDNVLNPRWNAVEGSLYTTINPADPEGFITFQVIDVGYDSGARRLGYAQLSTKDLISEGLGIRVFKLAVADKEQDPELLANKDKLGTLTVEIAPDTDLAAAQTDDRVRQAQISGSIKPQRYVISLLAGKNLLKRQTMPSPSVVAFDSSNNQIFKSVACKDTVNPTYVTDPNSNGTTILTAVDAGYLIFNVYDEGQNNRASLGMAKLKVSDVCAITGEKAFEVKIEAATNETDPFVVSAKDLGSLTISIKPHTVNVVAKDNAATVAVATPPPPTTPAVPQVINVRVTVKEGKDLAVKDVLTSDPVLKILKNGAEKFVAKTLTSTTNPKWDSASVGIDFLTPSKDVLEFKLQDEDKAFFGGALTYEDMGTVKLTVDEVMAKLGKTSEFPVMLEGSQRGVLLVLLEKI